MRASDIPAAPESLIDALIQARRLGRRRRNPVGSESYIELLPAAEIRDLRASRMFPKAKADLAAAPGYQYFFLEFSGITGGKTPRPMKGGIQQHLNEWTALDREINKDTIEWSGGYALLQNLGNDFLKDIADNQYDFGNMAPWSPENPMGTGIWRAMVERLRSREVRGDEAYVATILLKRMGIVVQNLAMGKSNLSPQQAKGRLIANLMAMFLVLFGTDDAKTINALNAQGIELLKADAAWRAERKAGREATKAGGVQMSAIERYRELQRAKVTGRVPSVGPSPADVIREAARQQQQQQEKVEEVVATVTAPITPAHPVEAKIRLLRRMGVSERIIARILAAGSVEEQLAFAADVLAAYEN